MAITLQCKRRDIWRVDVTRRESLMSGSA